MADVDDQLMPEYFPVLAGRPHARRPRRHRARGRHGGLRPQRARRLPDRGRAGRRRPRGRHPHGPRRAAGLPEPARHARAGPARLGGRADRPDLRPDPAALVRHGARRHREARRPDRPDAGADGRAHRRRVHLSDVEFAVLGPIVDPNEPEHLRRKSINRLKGYRGARFSATQVARLLALRDLLAGDPERDFRVRLWRAECHVGQARAQRRRRPAAGAGALPAGAAGVPATAAARRPRAVRPAADGGRPGRRRPDRSRRRAVPAILPASQPRSASEITEAYCAAIGLLRRVGTGRTAPSRLSTGTSSSS